jgi:RimJ/RimL family protein N-acetyltransferase
MSVAILYLYGTIMTIKAAPPISLRPTTEADLEFVVTAERDPANAPFIRQWTLAEHRAALRDPDIAHRVVESTAAGAFPGILPGAGAWRPAAARPEPVGYVILLGLASPHLGVEFKRLVVTRKGEGFGRAAVRAVTRWAFETHGAHRLWLEVKPFNERARAIYAGGGFREEGTLRDVIKGAAGYESLIVMSILQPEYRAARDGGAPQSG